jgi:hypothetical protein
MSEADLYDKLNDILSEYDKRGLSCEEAITMIKECAPYLITYKEQYGRQNNDYLTISTNIASAVLKKVISNLNFTLDTPDFLLKDLYIADLLDSEMDEDEVYSYTYERTKLDFKMDEKTPIPFQNAIIRTDLALQYINCLDVDAVFRKNILEPNIAKISKMKHSSCSPWRILHSPFCDLDMRSEDEFFSDCKSIYSLEIYCKRYPEGKYLVTAIREIERLKRLDKIWNITKISLIAMFVVVLFSLLYWFFIR